MTNEILPLFKQYETIREKELVMKKLIRPEDLLKEFTEAFNYAAIARQTWSNTQPIYETREQWLNSLMELLKPHFSANGYELNGSIRLSCGFPRGRKVIVGQCWSITQSKDQTTEIFISPNIDEPIEAGSILTHELCHAAVGVNQGHMTAFKHCALSVGLIGTMTATSASPDLIRIIADCFDLLGRYPHAALKDLDQKKQTTRLIKATCPDCGYNVRITRKWIDTAGCPICPTCDIKLKNG